MLHTFRGALNGDDIWFQQDGATAHTARDTLLLMRNFFLGCIISRLGLSTDRLDPQIWQLLTSFCGDTSKQRTFQPRPHPIQDLKKRIQAEVQEINVSPSLLQSIINNFLVRLQQVIRYQEDHLSCVVFRKYSQRQVENYQNQLLDPVEGEIHNDGRNDTHLSSWTKFQTLPQ